ncbi:Glu/Leu/Phe/Val dehydrogenase dimerization domain-containing protein [Neobacillus sp. D3-1R]|uniref:Glu/Leu/Phe/Val dehydrogenase family protein n=1 Tax=Neobacillus sp. D3-1R TaxID=3445778 RepID=UPI003F9F1774
MKSLFTPLKKEGLTTLKLRYNWKEQRINLFAAKEWEKDFDFSTYNKTFYNESILTDEARYLNTIEVKELYEKYDLLEYLEQVIDLLIQGKHFGMDCYYNDQYNIRFMGNIHSLALGINNRLHATLAGGIRRYGFDHVEKDVIINGLNLARAMSFKNVAANLAFGGCKTTVQMEPLDLNNLEMMGFLAFSLDKTRSMTGPDMNFPTEMADVMKEHFSIQYTGGPKGPLGETGKPTAFGTYLALKQAVKFLKGTERLDGLTIAVQGLGAVGWYMAEHLASENTYLIITDVNKERVEEFLNQHPDKDIKYVDPSEILKIKADILCPCAIGGILSEDNIPNLNFDIIFGPANNQLKASNQNEEIRLSRLISERGILFQESWWHNVAGVICGAEEYLEGENANYDSLINRIRETVPVKTWENLLNAKELGITPTESMYRICEKIIYQN